MVILLGYVIKFWAKLGQYPDRYELSTPELVTAVVLPSSE